MTTQQRIEIALRSGMVAHAVLELTKNPPELFPLLFRQLEKQVAELKDAVRLALGEVDRPPKTGG